ncbi:cation-translocating P-type ATPase [Geomonas oryzae]|uniref:cation-translocating P-type ATPase n=1 Tax=Geomonas oryzae TaxID=2364273 RepID=UPI00100B5E3F|nr:HAD-IC family P-type ATPase [Geomonas oryzae]
MHLVPLEEYCRRLRSDPQRGLSSAEALLRLGREGPNLLVQRRQVPELLKFLRQLTNLFAILLWIGAGLCLLAEFLTPGQGNMAIAIVLVGVVLLNGSFSYWQGRRAEEIMSSFRDMLPRLARVVRDGVVHEIQASVLVRGDLILLAEGDRVPADVRLVYVAGLKVDNSSLTGESEPQLRTIVPTEKRLLETRNVAFSGTQVLAGEGRGIIFATGMSTQIGRTAELTETLKGREIPIRLEITRFTRIISLIAVVMGGAVFLGSLLFRDAPVLANLIFAVGIIVANVPEGLLPTVTLCLSIAARRMGENKALVRNLDSVETLGCTTVVCTDKTGTLTTNRVSLQRLFLNECNHIESDATLGKEELEKFLMVAMLCNNARVTENGAFVGDPTETALLEFSSRFHPVAAFQAASPRLLEEPFTSATKMMVTVNLVGGEAVACLKGAPDVAIGLCDKILLNGVPVPFGEDHRKAYLAAYEEMSKRGERVLLFAWHQLPQRSVWETESIPAHGYTFIGLAGLFDPPRPEVPDAVAALRAAGVKVVMVTGDYQTTAVAIGRMVGIVTADVPAVITGEQLRTITEAHLDWELEQPEVIFARTSPEQKLRIVQALQRRGEVVAVTGDGVNDAPALKQADIGVAMGLSGTDVAREAADMVLLDDNFATLLPAVREGRTIFDNLKKSIGFTVTHAVPEVMPYLAFLIFAVPLPLTVTLILSIDLATDMLPAIALGRERAERDIMHLPPRSRNERLVGPQLLVRSYLVSGVIEAAAGFYAYFTVLHDGGWSWGMPLPAGDQLHGRSVAAFFAAVVLCQAVNAMAARTQRQSLLQQGLFSNKWHLVGVVSAILIALTIIELPPLQSAFGTAYLSPRDLLLAWPFAVGLLLQDELRRWLIRHNGYGRIAHTGA